MTIGYGYDLEQKSSTILYTPALSLRTLAFPSDFHVWLKGWLYTH